MGLTHLSHLKNWLPQVSNVPVAIANIAALALSRMTYQYTIFNSVRERSLWTPCKRKYRFKDAWLLLWWTTHSPVRFRASSMLVWSFCVSLCIVGLLLILAYTGWWIYIHTSPFHVAINRIPGPKYLPLIGNSLEMFGGLDRKALYL